MVADSSGPVDPRELVERLEEEVGPARLDEEEVGVQEDFAREVPGAAEPPD